MDVTVLNSCPCIPLCSPQAAEYRDLRTEIYILSLCRVRHRRLCRRLKSVRFLKEWKRTTVCADDVYTLIAEVVHSKHVVIPRNGIKVSPGSSLWAGGSSRHSRISIPSCGSTWRNLVEKMSTQEGPDRCPKGTHVIHKHYTMSAPRPGLAATLVSQLYCSCGNDREEQPSGELLVGATIYQDGDNVRLCASWPLLLRNRRPLRFYRGSSPHRRPALRKAYSCSHNFSVLQEHVAERRRLP